MIALPAFPVMLSVHGAVSFDTSPGAKQALLPGRSDQIRHFATRDHAGRLLLEGKASGDVPLLGFDFGSVFSRSAPMGAAPFDRSSPWVGRGGVTFLTGLFKRCFMPRH